MPGVHTSKLRHKTRIKRADIYQLLEFESKTDLSMPRCVQRTGHLAEGGIAKGRIGKIESRRIGEVEEFTADLEFHSFTDDEFLADGQIGVMDAITPQVGEITRSISGDLISRVGKAARVKDRSSIRVKVCSTGDVLTIGSGLVVAETRGGRTANDTGTLIAVRQAGIGHDNADRGAGLEGNEDRDGPSTDNAIQNSIHVLAHPPASSHGNIKNARDNKTVGGVIGADGIFGFEVVVDLRDSGAQAGGNERVCAGGRIVGGLRERIVAFEADVVARALLEAHLKRVVPRAGTEPRQPAEGTVKLRIRTQEVDERNLRVVIDRLGFIEDGVGALEKR
jgi:hypothetical protein